MRIRTVEHPIDRGPDEILGRYLESAVLEPVPDACVFPELFTVGYVLDQLPELALDPGEPEELPFPSLAAEYGMWLIPGTFPVRTEAGIVNRLHVYSPRGDLAHTTEKVHLFGQMGEDRVFGGGRPGGTFDMDGVTAGAIVCYDLRFPELARSLALDGCRIMFVPAQWPASRRGLFRCLLRARSAESQTFTVGCNLGGSHLGVDFCGGGAVARPSGELLDSEEVEEGVRDYLVDPSEVEEMRRKLSCIEDRRPDTYGSGWR
ncbi:MAG: nitrilase-related carbon-nitrogen hydrolase [Candidatus Fermentibacteraceae bacterium]